MVFRGLKCCKYNRFPCYVQTKKMNLIPFFLAKTKCIIIPLESIIMDFIISKKSHYFGFFPTLFRTSCKILHDFINFCNYQMSYAEILPASVWPNPFLNLNSYRKKIPLRSPPNVCFFAPLQPPVPFAPLLPSPTRTTTSPPRPSSEPTHPPPT